MPERAGPSEPTDMLDRKRPRWLSTDLEIAAIPIVLLLVIFVLSVWLGVSPNP